MADAAAFKPLPLRKHTGTAHRRLRPEFSDFGLEDLEKLTELQAVELLAKHFWGSATEMPCPHCGTIDTHYWRRREMRWKCKCCDKTFSVTSGTPFAGHKLPLLKILKITVSWINGASGKPALQLMRDWRVAYGTAFTICHRLRESLVRGHNTGIVCGVHEMDGLDVLGRNHAAKRGKPQVVKSTGKKEFPKHLLKDEQAAGFVGPAKPPKWDKKANQHPDRRILLVTRLRGRSKGMGAVATFVAVAITESAKAVFTLARRHASAESAIMSDEDPSYAAFGSYFAAHETVNHSETFSRDGRISNNLAESFNMRMKRLIRGVYLNVSQKYLADYGCEAAWREDVRELPTSRKLGHLLSMVGRVGVSLWWCGFSHGQHRGHELTVDGELPAKARGRRKGQQPKPPR
ncbi:IS1595 family transposase [Ramlibacter alkalitolerans]|uniref:IS1595 family transposase n=1 Tax=Ramlibacter alkalitolerans TaxID=2039631 RepID=A0ABS1JX70_9BURK|nr:IS1595 family transposase [Ramlibacter alkalitolerans]MBL0428736.1 IS1595 family transposase [Ramlibacter alkalitolerans]